VTRCYRFDLGRFESVRSNFHDDGNDAVYLFFVFELRQTDGQSQCRITHVVRLSARLSVRPSQNKFDQSDYMD